MNSALILQDVVYVVALLAIGYPLGCYIYKIYNGERVALMRIFAPLEQLLYRVMGVDEEQQMHAKKYASSVLWFSLFGFLIVMGLHLVQAWLPLNPEQLENTSVHWQDLPYRTLYLRLPESLFCLSCAEALCAGKQKILETSGAIL